MATQFQNRLIGTVILVSLGVIFLPDLLLGEKNDIAAPAGSIPLRPEQSLAQQATPVVSAANPSSANNTSIVVAGNNVSAATTTVSASSAVVTNNENWQVEEVAAPVTVTENGAVTENIATVANEKQQAAELEKVKNREQELKKKEILAAAKAKELAKAKEIALETPKAPDAVQSVTSETEVSITETARVEPETTVRRDESGLIIKTPAQVEAERAALKSPSSVSTTGYSAPKAVSTAAHSGSWIIQVGVFSNAENAQALAAKLRSAGYGASAQRSGQLTRVMVGPDVSKEKLQSMLSNINRVGGTSARVITYSAVGN